MRIYTDLLSSQPTERVRRTVWKQGNISECIFCIKICLRIILLFVPVGLCKIIETELFIYATQGYFHLWRIIQYIRHSGIVTKFQYLKLTKIFPSCHCNISLSVRCECVCLPLQYWAAYLCNKSERRLSRWNHPGK